MHDMGRDYTPPPDYTQEAKFYNEARKVYVPMSDGAELLVLYTKKGKHPSGFSVFFVPGFATGPFSWNDLWDELYEQFDLYVLETREKISSHVKWRHKATMERLGLDVKEAFEYFNLDPQKTLFIGPCFGAAVIASAIANKWLNPAGFVLIGPPDKFKLPTILMPLAYIFPSFFMGIIGKPLLKLWLKLTVPPGIQRETYVGMLKNANGMRWKKMLPVAWYNSLNNYMAIECPSWVIGAATDKMHEADTTKKIANSMKNARYLEVPSYDFMHHYPGAKEFGEMIKGFVEELAHK